MTDEWMMNKILTGIMLFGKYTKVSNSKALNSVKLSSNMGAKKQTPVTILTFPNLKDLHFCVYIKAPKVLYSYQAKRVHEFYKK